MTHFRHVSDWGESRFSEELGVNLVQFVNQAYLNIGAFQNVEIPTTGTYGGDMHRLRPVDDPRYSEGQVWQSFRKNWVWEEVDYDYQPISISGVYIDGTFQPTTGIGDYSFHIDYPNGQIIFDAGVDRDSEITLEYSYKLVSIYDDRSDWFKEIQYNSNRLDNEHFTQYGSGAWSILAQNRVQLPCIVVSPLANVSLRGRELGNHNERWQDVIFNIFAENSWDRNTLTDDIINQKDSVLHIFDYNKVLESGVYPLSYDGSINPSGLGYSDLIEDYYYRRMTIEEVGAEQLFGESPPYNAVVRWTVSQLI